LLKFTTWCHQNYTSTPEIILQRQKNNSNNSSFMDYNRPKIGVYSNLSTFIHYYQKNQIKYKNIIQNGIIRFFMFNLI